MIFTYTVSSRSWCRGMLHPLPLELTPSSVLPIFPALSHFLLQVLMLSFIFFSPYGQVRLGHQTCILSIYRHVYYIDIVNNVKLRNLTPYDFHNMSVILPIRRHIDTILPVLHIPFLAFSFLWMSSIPAHQVPIVLQVPIQATQHKDDTNPSCISSVLFRVLVIFLFSGCSFIPAHQVPIQATQHKNDTLYPS